MTTDNDSSVLVTPVTDIDLIARLNKSIQPMLDGPTQLATAWLEKHGWAAIPVPETLNDMDAEWISTAAAALGCQAGFAISTELGSPSDVPACYRVSLNQPSLLALDREVSLQHFLLVPDGNGFAILLEGDYFFVVAGPPSFVRQAVGCSFSTAKAMFVDRYADSDDWPPETRKYLLSVWKRYEGFNRL